MCREFVKSSFLPVVLNPLPVALFCAAPHFAYFDTDKATLRPDSEATLLQIQKVLTSHPEMKLEIQGHTDNTGTREHNQTLSEARAASVKA